MTVLQREALRIHADRAAAQGHEDVEAALRRAIDATPVDVQLVVHHQDPEDYAAAFNAGYDHGWHDALEPAEFAGPLDRVRHRIAAAICRHGHDA